MSLRHLFTPAAATPPSPPLTADRPAYPFPEGFVERLKHDLRAAGAQQPTGVQVGFESPRLAAFLLAHAVSLFAIESDQARREAGERLCSSWPAFQVRAGAPDSTGLPDASVDFIVSDRALYWPDQAGVRCEFTRILRPGAPVALITDNRVYAGGEQAQEFEAILRRGCPSFREKRNSLDIGGAVAELFRDGSVFEDAFTGEQKLTLPEFLAQTEAMPVYPAAGDPARAVLDRELRSFFARWSKRGSLTVPTVCRVAFGRMTPQRGLLV